MSKQQAMQKFKVQPKLCPKHPEKETDFACMKPGCKPNILNCVKCVDQNLHKQHKENAWRYTDKLFQDIQNPINYFLGKFKELQFDVTVEQFVQKQRSFVEQEYMQLVENVAKCLEEERRRLFEDFDLLERLSGAEREKTRAVQGRLRSLQYLRQMTDGMLELKMATGSAQGLRELKRHALVLEGLTEEDLRAGESAGRMRAEVGRKVAERLEGSMTRRFNALFTQRIMDRYLSPAAQPKQTPRGQSAQNSRERSFSNTGKKRTPIFERKGSMDQALPSRPTRVI